MNRRALFGAAAAAAPVALAAPAIAQTAPEVRWRLTSSFPKNLDILFSTPEMIAKRVAALTDNKFQIRVFAAGEIVGGLQALAGMDNKNGIGVALPESSQLGRRGGRLHG